MVNECRNVFPAFLQRRHVDREHVEAVEQVFAERTGFHLARQVTVGRGDDAHVHLGRAARTHSVHFAFLQGTEQFHLCVQRQLADLIEEQRAAIGLDKLAGGFGNSAGKRALLMAKQDRLHEVFRNGAAVDRHERLARPGAGALNAARDHFLTHTAFAQDQHRNIRGRPALCHADDAAHRRGGGNHVLELHAAFGLAREAFHFARQALHLQRVADRDDHTFGIGRLDDEVHRAAPHRLHDRVDPARCRQHDHRQVRALGVQTLQRLHARKARHRQIQQHDIHAFARVRRQLQARLAIGRRAAGKTRLFDGCLKQAALRRIIIDHQDRLRHGNTL